MGSRAHGSCLGLKGSWLMAYGRMGHGSWLMAMTWLMAYGPAGSWLMGSRAHEPVGPSAHGPAVQRSLGLRPLGPWALLFPWQIFLRKMVYPQFG